MRAAQNNHEQCALELLKAGAATRAQRTQGTRHSCSVAKTVTSSALSHCSRRAADPNKGTTGFRLALMQPARTVTSSALWH